MDSVRVGDRDFEVGYIIQKLGALMTPERVRRLDEVAGHRSLRLAAVLENIYDRGNVSAVMRSFEAFGFLRMHLIDAPTAKFKAANRVTKGAEKWLEIQSHKSPIGAVERLRADGYQIWATDLNTSVSIQDLDWSKPTAIVLGNEKDGVSPELRAMADGCFRVPMLGFSQSFNISVAAALIFYHAHLQLRGQSGAGALSDAEKRLLLAKYYVKCFDNPERLLGL